MKGVAPPLQLGVVTIEKGAFGSPSTTVTNFTFTYNLSKSNQSCQIVLHIRKKILQNF